MGSRQNVVARPQAQGPRTLLYRRRDLAAMDIPEGKERHVPGIEDVARDCLRQLVFAGVKQKGTTWSHPVPRVDGDGHRASYNRDRRAYAAASRITFDGRQFRGTSDAKRSRLLSQDDRVDRRRSRAGSQIAAGPTQTAHPGQPVNCGSPGVHLRKSAAGVPSRSTPPRQDHAASIAPAIAGSHGRHAAAGSAEAAPPTISRCAETVKRAA